MWVPTGVREISATAFSHGQTISSIHIPDSVLCVARYAFASCASLKEITIGFGVGIIPMGCFAELHNLETVTLTDCIKSIDDYAFYHCVSLREITFLTKKYRDPITPAEKGKAFERMLSGQSPKIEDIDIAEHLPTLRRIGNYAFAGCKWLDTDALAEVTTVVGMYAFDEKQEEKIATTPTVVQPVYNVVEEIVDNIVDVEESVVDETSTLHEPLVAGYMVKDGVIYHETSMQCIDDAPITVLDLSTRAYNCLNRTRAYSLREDTDVMISNVMKYSPDGLRNIRNILHCVAFNIFNLIQIDHKTCVIFPVVLIFIHIGCQQIVISKQLRFFISLQNTNDFLLAIFNILNLFYDGKNRNCY